MVWILVLMGALGIAGGITTWILKALEDEQRDVLGTRIRLLEPPVLSSDMPYVHRREYGPGLGTSFVPSVQSHKSPSILMRMDEMIVTYQQRYGSRATAEMAFLLAPDMFEQFHTECTICMRFSGPSSRDAPPPPPEPPTPEWAFYRGIPAIASNDVSEGGAVLVPRESATSLFFPSHDKNHALLTLMKKLEEGIDERKRPARNAEGYTVLIPDGYHEVSAADDLPTTGEGEKIHPLAPDDIIPLDPDR